MYATKNKWNKTLGQKSVLLLKKNLDQKKFGRQILCPKIFLVSNGVQNDFGAKKFHIQNKMMSAKMIFNPQKLRAHKNLSEKKISVNFFSDFLSILATFKVLLNVQR